MKLLVFLVYKWDIEVKTQPKNNTTVKQSFDMSSKEKHLFELFEILPKKLVRIVWLLDTKLHDTVFQYGLNVMFFYINFTLPERFGITILLFGRHFARKCRSEKN